MASDRTEYPAMLGSLHPGQAVDVLSERVRQIGRLNTTIADWLLERQRLEEQYAAGLRRLARSQVDDVDLGVFSVPWTSLTNSMDALAEAHAGLATKIEVDVERPLREFQTSNREMQALSTMRGNLTALAKDVEKAQRKADKLNVRGDRIEMNRVLDNANSDLDHARSEWEAQAPYAFENLQLLDETRVGQLRDALTQFLTLEADQVEKSRVAAEQSLNVLLNVETADEIKTFAIKTVSSPPKASVSRTQRASFAPTSPPSRPAASASSNLAPIPSNTEEAKTERSASFTEPKKGGLKGLKRLGTVMGRRKDKDKKNEPQVPAVPSTTDTPEPDRTKRFTTFGRLGRSKESYSLEPPQDSASLQRPRSPLRRGSEALEPPTPRSELDAAPRLPEMNGIQGHHNDLSVLDPPAPVNVEAASASPVDRSRDTEGFSAPPANLDPISLAQTEAAAATNGGEESTTQQLYNVNIRKAPIQEEGSEAALASMANKLQAPPPTTARRSGTVRGRRDARNSAIVTNFTPAAQPVAEPVAEPASIATHTAEPATSFPAVAPVSAPQTSLPVSNATFSQSPLEATTPIQASTASFAPFAAPAAIQPDPVRPSSRTATGFEAADNQSIRSGRSAVTTASQGVRHPELQQGGLNSSIIETVSARFDRGKLTSSSLIGEIALVYNPVHSSTPLGPEIIRLDNFSSLEKVAPNPAFITQSAGKAGEYSVSLSGIARTQVAFKYQLRASDASTQTPLLITPASRIEPSQTSIIVNYSLNPEFNNRGQSTITLHNVMLALSLEGAKASSCQSKPVGTFNREKGLIFWQLGDVTLETGAAPQKLLARFATDSEARSGSVEARWEVSSELAQSIGSGLAVSALHATGADPFADDDGNSAGAWKPVPSMKKLMGAGYVAKS